MLPRIGHAFGLAGCGDAMLDAFITRATTRGLDTTGCASSITVAPFAIE